VKTDTTGQSAQLAFTGTEFRQLSKTTLIPYWSHQQPWLPQ